MKGNYHIQAVAYLCNKHNDDCIMVFIYKRKKIMHYKRKRVGQRKKRG